jgi:hypothetical protein
LWMRFAMGRSRRMGYTERFKKDNLSADDADLRRWEDKKRLNKDVEKSTYRISICG